MKKFILFLCWAVVSITTVQAQEVKFNILDGVENDALKASIEENLSNLMTEVNRAQSAGTPLNFASFRIDEEAQRQLSMLWENVPFRCVESKIIERVMQVTGGYQVRNIPLELKPADAKVTDDAYQEAVIDFDHSGRIISFYFAISNNLYAQVMRYGMDGADMRRRQRILDYVERLYTAYYQKDVDYLQKVFGDDGIVITGKVIKIKPSDFNPMPKDKVVYNTQCKNMYLSNLKAIFDRSKYVRVTFSEIKVTRHPTKEHCYGVLLRQGYKAHGYGDDGYLFLLWDFIDEQNPMISSRTWQPYWVGPNTKISEDDIFNISMFDI